MTERREIIAFVQEARAKGVRFKAACSALGVSPRTVQRWMQGGEEGLRDDGRRTNKFPRSNALSPEEEKRVVEIACSPEFRDKSPNQIVPKLAEKGTYVASERTFYRILRRRGLLVHRGRAKAPERERPKERVATGSNQVWTWDISYLATMVRGVFLYLYVMLDIWDRSIVGWTIQETESGEHAAALLRTACFEAGVEPGSVVVHQDNGAPMVSADFLAELSRWGEASYSRPGVCDDNPYSEAWFRTAKYHPGYPMRFGSIEDAREWLEKFVHHYNHEHLHSGIRFVTPMQRRTGEEFRILEARKKTYAAARAAHPERWTGNTRNWNPITAVSLNPRHGKRSGQRKAA